MCIRDSGKVVRAFLPKADLLAYVEAILRGYNLIGRRDYKYNARIKILVHETGLEAFSALVERELGDLISQNGGSSVAIDAREIARIESYFAPPAFETLDADDPAYKTARAADAAFDAWCAQSLEEHRRPGYAIATISLKAIGHVPGDATSDQMSLLADIAEEFGHDELRISHEQNVVLPHVRKRDLPVIFARLQSAGLATANVGLISDIIACPGMDYCALATARSIPIAQDIARHFSDPAYAVAIGEMKIKISGCINACGHHHVAHIGILGLDRRGVENYQITLGGDHTETLAIGERAGPGFAANEVVPAIQRLIDTYLDLRLGPKETFLMVYRRVGAKPFKAALYPKNDPVAVEPPPKSQDHLIGLAGVAG